MFYNTFDCLQTMEYVSSQRKKGKCALWDVAFVSCLGMGNENSDYSDIKDSKDSLIRHLSDEKWSRKKERLFSLITNAFRCLKGINVNSSKHNVLGVIRQSTERERNEIFRWCLLAIFLPFPNH